MIFTETALPGAYRIDLELHEDERGFFARTWCEKEFQAHGLNTRWVQSSLSFNKRAGTLRGMHFQEPPFEEIKLVHCFRGSVHDVIIDLRRDSPSFKQHLSVTLSAGSCAMLYVPKGFAHGFLTLEDNTEVFYQISQFYSAEHARGVRADDPAFQIRWPAEVRVISQRDRAYPDFHA